MRIAIIAFHPLASDSRVLRTARALHEAGHRVLLVGHGPAPAGVGYDVALLPDLPSPFLIRAGLVLRQAPATLMAASAKRLYWLNAARRRARAILRSWRPDVVHANDWNTLPLALDAKAGWGALIVYDTHELAVAEYEHSLKWRLAALAHVRAIEAQGIAQADAVIAVSPGIARALPGMYPGLGEPVVIRNVPDAEPMPFHPTGPTVTVLFHGLLRSNRGLEPVLASMPDWPERFRLVLRGPCAPAYRAALERQVAERGLSRRVSFEPPVSPAEVVPRAAEADLGLCVLPDTSRHNRYALPNKLFEYLMAGLGVVVSPLPDMAELVQSTGCGVLTEAEPGAIAAALRGLDPAAIDRLKRQALAAASSLNWASESRKLLALYDTLAHP
jgi:glycosyltransferase involved in cell wall biosynthesis